MRARLLAGTLALLASCGGGASTSSSDEAATSAGYDGMGAQANASSPAPPRMERDASFAKATTEESMQATAPTSPATPASPAATAAGAEPSVAPNMVIRTGVAVLEVDSLEQAAARVQAAAQRLGGYVANSSVQGGRDEMRSATLELKVPAARFDELVRGLEPIGRVESMNVNAQDVGEEFVDVQARVANARRLEERLVVLLATRTGKLEEVLAVERELARVREEVERYEGRLRFLRTRVAVSTLTVTVHEPAPIVGRVQGASPIAEAVRQAWRNFVALVAGLIALSGVLIPLALVAAAAYALWRRWRPRSSAPSRDETMTE